MMTKTEPTNPETPWERLTNWSAGHGNVPENVRPMNERTVAATADRGLS